MSSVTRSVGFNIVSGSPGTIADEGISEMDSATGHSPQEPSQPQSACLTRMHERSPSLQSPVFLRTGCSLGPVLLRKVVMTDASLMGWGAVFAGRTVRGVWSPALREKYINFLDLLKVFLALRHFVHFLRIHHIFGQDGQYNGEPT